MERLDVDMLQSIEKREEFEKEVGAGLSKGTSLYPLFHFHLLVKRGSKSAELTQPLW